MKHRQAISFILCLTIRLITSEHITKRITLHHNVSRPEPLLESEQPGNRLVLNGYITIATEKCCPVMFLGHHIRGIPLQNGCLDIASFESATGLLDRSDSPFYLLAWNKTKELVSGYVQTHMQCNYHKDGRYTCSFHQLTRNTIREDLGRLYIFYTCFNRQHADIMFNLSLEGKVINQTEYPAARCLPMRGDNVCSKYYADGVLPNAFGDLKRESAMKVMLILQALTAPCHKHFEEVLCHLSLPKCEDENHMLLCKSSCKEVFTVCGKYFLQENLTDTGFLLQNYIYNYFGKGNTSTQIGNIINVAYNFYCNELPDRVCVKTDKVTCMPQHVEHGTHDANMKIYFVHSTIEYKCDSGYNLDSNGTATCQYSGKWSRIPKCLVQTSHKDLITVCFIFGAFIIIVVSALIIIWKYRHELSALLYVKYGIKFMREREERRKYDAYIAYSQNDFEFVKRNIIDPLQGMEFNLCVPARDFEAGDFKSQMIVKSVKDSKRTIIVLSQNFINSEWCQFEFAQSHLKLLEDESFKLLLIAYDDPKTLMLKDAPKLITEYINSRTYLAKDNSLFFEKLLYQMPKDRNIQNKYANKGHC